MKSSTFSVQIQLDDESTHKQELQPLFSQSELLTVRLPLPFALSAAQHAGQLAVTRDGFGMRTGDVLRLCSTYERDIRSRAQLALRSILPAAAPPSRRFMFECDGQPMDRVRRALVANSETVGATDILLVLEREQRSDDPVAFDGMQP